MKSEAEGGLIAANEQQGVGGTVSVVVLAAGASTRMGTPKQLLPYRERSLLRHAAEMALASVCQPIIVVLGAHAERLRQEVNDLPVQVVENLRWAEGMSSSISTGVAALNAAPDKISAVVLALCDQPFVSAQVINEIVEAYHSTGKPVVASEYAGTLGVPTLFSRPLFSELMALRGGEGAKQVITKYGHEVFSVPFPEGAVDIDTPNDYEQFRTMAELF
jgi:molybdenum cofactor cytidylyltransferase